MKIAFALLFFLVSSHSALAQPAETYVTSGVGVLCVRFTDIKEAMTAAASGDMAWIKSLDCAKVSENLPVVVIDQLKSTSDFDPWKVRITLPDGRGASVWGPVFAFRKATDTRKKD